MTEIQKAHVEKESEQQNTTVEDITSKIHTLSQYLIINQVVNDETWNITAQEKEMDDFTKVREIRSALMKREA